MVRGSKKPPLRKGVTRTRRNEEIIVSLTSYEERLPYLPRVLNTLLRQSVKPNRIIVWLSCDLSLVPANVLAYTQKGIEFRHVPLDLKGHKKYYYAFREYPDALIVTVDDDIIYSRDTISSLLKYHKRYRNDVIARRVHRIVMSDGKPAPYNEWVYEDKTSNSPSFRLCCTSGGGSLFSKNCLDLTLLDSDLIINTCLYADDIFLKYMSLLNGSKTVWVKNNYFPLLEVDGTQQNCLSRENVTNKQNDRYVATLEEAFHQKVKEITGLDFY